jgi:hypothetical protein
MYRPRAEQELEREILPLRNVREVAQALSQMYQGANLSMYGADNALVATLEPLVAALGQGIARAGERATASEE